MAKGTNRSANLRKADFHERQRVIACLHLLLPGTGLFYAVLNTHEASEPLAEHLISKHADVNYRDSYRKTPLHYACEENRRGCAMLLLRYRADPAAQDGINRLTPIQVASSKSLKKEIRAFLGMPVDSEDYEDKAVESGAERAAGSAGSEREQMRGSTGSVTSGNRNAGRVARARRGVEFELQSERAGDVAPAIAKAPVALGLNFAQLRDRFIRLMARVQEGGLQQYAGE